MRDPHSELTLQMLQWINQETPTYAEVMEVWKSSCPWLTIWEDACAGGLVDAAPGRSGIVFLTERGKRLLGVPVQK